MLEKELCCFLCSIKGNTESEEPTENAPASSHSPATHWGRVQAPVELPEMLNIKICEKYKEEEGKRALPVTAVGRVVAGLEPRSPTADVPLVLQRPVHPAYS